MLCSPANTFFAKRAWFLKPTRFTPLRALAAEHPKQILQVGFERRYSSYFQAMKKMIDDGVLGTVTHIHAQWNRNPGWTMQPGGKDNLQNWRLFREFSGGLTAVNSLPLITSTRPIGSLGPHPRIRRTGVGGLDFRRDGRRRFR